MSMAHYQQLTDLGLTTCELLVMRHAHQDMGRSAPVGDEHRAKVGGFFGFADRLVEFTA
jgi:hypothetical protein